MTNELIKKNQAAAEEVREKVIENSSVPHEVGTMQYVVMLNVYIMLCEIARRLPPPLDDTE